MTLEKFEDKVIGMLLKGDDPRLKKINKQLVVSETLSRKETSMGFELGFSIPAEFAIDELEGRIFGVEVQLSEYPIVHIELMMKNGKIDKLKASYTTELSYAELVEHHEELTFVYTNGKTSSLALYSNNQNSDDPIFVKNIATISDQFDEYISQSNLEETEKVVRDTESIASTKSPIIPKVEDLERIVAQLEDEQEDTGPTSLDAYKAELIEESFERKLADDDFEEIVAEVVGSEAPLNSKFTEVDSTSSWEDKAQKNEHEAIIDDVLKNFQTKSADVQTTEIEEYDDILLPPSFSIPKVPDAIKERWSTENAATQGQIQQDGDMKQEILTQILSQQDSNNGRVTLREEASSSLNSYRERKAETSLQPTTKYYESNVGLSEVLDGKAPQGGSSGRRPAVKDEPRFSQSGDERLHASSSLGDENISANKIKENFEFKNLSPRELSNPDLNIENPNAVEPELLESIALSEMDEEQMNRDIARMEKEQRGTEVRIAAIFIILGIICMVAFVLIAIF